VTEYSTSFVRSDALPGWNIYDLPFDFGAKWGVAIDNGKEPPNRRRYAVMTKCHNRADAIRDAMPALIEWAEQNTESTS
jgi:hypothetical protein